METIQGHASYPHHVFDMIAGTSTGGKIVPQYNVCNTLTGRSLIAVMLGPLRMSVTECIDEYLKMAPDVFPIENRIVRTKPIVYWERWRGKERFDARPLEEFI